MVRADASSFPTVHVYQLGVLARAGRYGVEFVQGGWIPFDRCRTCLLKMRTFGQSFATDGHLIVNYRSVTSLLESRPHPISSRIASDGSLHSTTAAWG